jgi:hypothetical protein
MDGELAPPVKEIMDDADGLYEDWMLCPSDGSTDAGHLVH